MTNCNYKVKITDIQNKYRFKIFCATDLSNYYTISEVDNLLDDKVDISDLSSVATSGSYNDLSNKPSIPTKTSDLTNDSEFITDTDFEERVQNIESEIYILTSDISIENSAINSSGNIVSVNGMERTDYIPTDKFNKIIYYGYLGSSYTRVAYYDSEKNFLSNISIQGTGAKAKQCIDIPSTAKYVIFSNNVNQVSDPIFIVYKENSLAKDVENIKETLSYYPNVQSEATILTPDININGYISANGFPTYAASSKRTDFIKIFDYNKISYTGYQGTNYRQIAFYDENKIFLPDISINGSNAKISETIDIPSTAKYVIFSNYTTQVNNPTFILYKENSLAQKINSGNSPLMNKKIGFLGDSITNGYGVDTPFRVLIANNTSAIQVNYGINSSTLSNYNGGSNPVVERYVNMDNDLDYVCVLIGTNDWGAGVPLGEENSTDTTTFNGALNVLIEGLLNKYPNKKIMFMTLLQRRNATVNAGILDKCNAIKNRCAYYSVPCFDLYSQGLNPHIDNVNNALFYNADGLHPNTQGHILLANKIQKWLESI